MIEVKNLTKYYGSRKAIEDVSFKIDKGEVVGLLGPNGAGKSTVMKIMAGLMAPHCGSSSIAGYDVYEQPLEVKKRIGYLPEIPPLYGEMYVRGYLEYVARLKRVPSQKLKTFVDLALEKTQLEDVQTRLIQNLSKGYQQRVGIAQALVSQPEVLIFDEPTVGLDPLQVSEIRSLIKGLQGEHTVILSTHILSEVQVTCGRIIIIHEGHIVAQDRLENLSQMMTRGNRVQIKVLRPREDVIPQFSQILGVRSVQLENDLYRIETDSQAEILEQLSALGVRENLGLLSMETEKMGIEEIFLKLTYGDKEGQK